MAKVKVIDLSLCQGCRGCQVACKQWNQLPAVTQEEGLNMGSYENPPDLSAKTWNLVRFHEFLNSDGSVQFTFFPDACRHCPEPFCMQYCPVEGAITKDPDTGAVVIHSELCGDCCGECVAQCPYGIPKLETSMADDGAVTTYYRAYKCKLCNDRVTSNVGGDNTVAAGQDQTALGVLPSTAIEAVPACAKTCPAGAIQFIDESLLTNTNTYPGTGYSAQWILNRSAEDLGLTPATMADAQPKKTEPQDRRSALAGLLKPLGIGMLKDDKRKG